MARNETGNGSHSIWEQIAEAYNPVYIYVAYALCACGVVINIINIVVFTRKQMCGVIYVTLALLAVADLLLILFHTLVVFCLDSDFITLEEAIMKNQTVTLSTVYGVSSLLTAAFRNISLWLAFVTILFQYMDVSRPLTAIFLCSRQRARMAVCLVYVAGVLYYIPKAYFTL